MSFLDKIGARVGDFLGEVLLPEDVRLLHERAREAMDRQEYVRAQHLLDEALRRRPDIERTHHLMGLCLAHRQEYSAAIAAFERALHLREEPSTHLHLGLTLERLARNREAQLQFQRALSSGEELPFAFDLHFGLGRVFLEQGRPDKAARELRRALRLAPDQTEASVVLARALTAQGKHNEASELLAALPDTSHSLEYLMVLGDIAAHQDHPARAADAFEQVLDREPNHSNALLGAARAHLAMHQPARAHPLLLRACSLPEGQNNAEIHSLIARTYAQVGDHERALASFEAALERDPTRVEAHRGAGKSALELKRYERAREHFEMALAHGDAERKERPEQRAELLYGLGRCRLHTGDLLGARHLLDEALLLSTHHRASYLHALAEVALQLGDAAEAVITLDNALRAHPTSALRETLEYTRTEALRVLRPSWQPPSDTSSAAELVAALEALLHTYAADARLATRSARLRELLDHLNAPLSVAIVGEFNAGKSTLVNALLGEEVVPMGVLPTTAHACIMRYGPRAGARIVYEDGHQRDVDFDGAREHMRREPEAIARLDYAYPHPELRSLNFWDTPGFNALDPRHETLAEDALSQAEAIIWLLDANQALSDTEFERLESIPRASERLLIVLNKIDRLGPEGARQEALDEIIEHIEDHVGDDSLGIFPISALEALRARSSTTTIPPAFEALLDIIDRRLVQRSTQIKVSAAHAALREWLDELEHFRSQLDQDYAAHERTLEELRTALARRAPSPTTRAASVAEALIDQLDFVVVGIEREFSEALRPGGRIFTRQRLEDEDRDFITELFSQRVDDLLDRTMGRLLQDIEARESTIAADITPLLASLNLSEARALRRRLDGFFDTSRALKLALRDRVFGQWRARTQGQLRAANATVFDALVELPAEDVALRRDKLRELIPRVDQRFTAPLTDWLEEFSLAEARFCDRLRRDLAALRLEASHRYNLTSSASSP
ncbi:hypothetical protein DL240_11500 [Lujinxingia litoralis]|uniref:Dynamin N-terminal domain-containing protein n=1 Tax=Lujinxingia litoralis TaxID=2211119 RepID=A0A328CA16_9DELT|nr:tetratricopeptide repeat protein [Lujinxingia litoralis]RAL22463.1 hypothetical protein DL240_11500 [Lujinxingia litoralis]